MKQKFREFCKYNFMVFIWMALAVFIECISVCFMGLSPILTKPLYIILVFGLLSAMLLLFKHTLAKSITATILLAGQGAMQLGFIYLYDSNGTFFEWSMVSQRNDAWGTIEDLSLRWGLFAILLIILLGYITAVILTHLLLYKKQNCTKYNSSKFQKAIFAIVLCVCAFFTVANPTISAVAMAKESYVEKYLYGSADNKYQQLGITGNTIYEFFNGTMVNGLVKHDSLGLEDYIYNGEDPYLAHSDYHGISKGNNLVYILVESFEWYVFLQNCTPEQSAILYPNLNKFFNDSIYASSFYSREKTDTAELLSLIGSNPTGKYTNYDFPKNAFPFALPNMFRDSVLANGNEVKQIKSFHQNTRKFYNRDDLHPSIGFDEFVSIEKMEDYGVENTWSGGLFKGERTLDSLTMQAMKDEMFPQTADNEQYMTYWLTFSMHGYYASRKNLAEQGYYDKLDEVGAYPAGLGTKGDYLRTYAATVMDFDKAVGIMMDKLEENGQLDKTTIVMFADHNTYYNNLSYYAKGIEEKFNSELYRVPFMIYDQELSRVYERTEGKRSIDKFTTTADMLPTILDLFGIEGYKNLYFGTSMFIPDVESIIFSRAYGIFVTDKVICYSVKDLLYTCEGFTDEDLQDFIARAEKHLNKLEFIDKVYYNNWFKNHAYVKI